MQVFYFILLVRRALATPNYRHEDNVPVNTESV